MGPVKKSDHRSLITAMQEPKAKDYAVGMGEDLRFALVCLLAIGVIISISGGVLYVVNLFPRWIDLLLLAGIALLSVVGIRALRRWWWTRAARFYYGQLGLDRPALLVDVDHKGVRVQPHISLMNYLPERLDYEMVEFSVTIGYRSKVVGGYRGIVNHVAGASFSGGVMEVQVPASSRIDATIGYEIIYGPSLGRRYLIRERQKGIALGGTVLNGKFVPDAQYTATESPMTDIITGGRRK